MEPSRLHRALRELLGRGLVTNDRFDPLRSGSDSTLHALSRGRRNEPPGPLAPNPAEAGAGAAGRGAMVASGSCRLSIRNRDCWRGLAVLLERYGVLTREVVALGSVGTLLGRSGSAVGKSGMAWRDPSGLFRGRTIRRAVCAGGGRT